MASYLQNMISRMNTEDPTATAPTIPTTTYPSPASNASPAVGITYNPHDTGGIWPFGGDRPGESQMFAGSAIPLRQTQGQILSQLGAVPGVGQTSAEMFGLSPDIQNLFMPDANIQGRIFQNIMGMLRPQQEQQTADLSNQLAAMGLGGGRAARALAQQQRDFGTQATDITNQLLQQQLQGQQTAGQVISNLLGQQLSGNQALQQSLTGMLPGLAIAESQLPSTILDVFQNRGGA